MTTSEEFGRFLRARCEGVLQANDRRRSIRFVTDRATGALILPLERVELEADELVLFVPDEGEGGAQMLVSATAIDEGRPTDRWLAYHASPDASHWCQLRIEAARLHNELVDSMIDLTCPFAADEPMLCKRANAAPDALTDLCTARGVNDPAPVLVGVDEHGADVRTRVGIVRFEFDQRVAAIEDAIDALDRLIGAQRT